MKSILQPILIFVGIIVGWYGAEYIHKTYFKKDSAQTTIQAKETIRNSEYFEIKIKDEVIVRLQEDGKFFVEGKEVATDKELFEGFKRAILEECK